MGLGEGSLAPPSGSGRSLAAKRFGAFVAKNEVCGALKLSQRHGHGPAAKNAISPEDEISGDDGV